VRPNLAHDRHLHFLLGLLGREIPPDAPLVVAMDDTIRSNGAHHFEHAPTHED
jgi:hypothetical protein